MDNTDFHKRLAEWSFHNDVRIEQMHILPMACPTALNENLYELFEDNSGDDLKRMVINGRGFIEAVANLIDQDEVFYNNDGDLVPFWKGSQSDKHDYYAELFSRFGRELDWPTFLVLVSQPIRRYFGSGGTYGHSWGYYTSQWIAGSSFSELALLTNRWANQNVSEWKTEVAA